MPERQRPKCEAINWQRKCAPQELSDTVLDHSLKQPHQQVHLHLRVQRRRKENVKLGGGGKGGDDAPAGSVTLGRLQFSWEKAKAVSARTPQARESRMVSSSARRPASCPADGGSPRSRAHRAFPSITTATCCGSDSACRPPGRTAASACAAAGEVAPARGHGVGKRVGRNGATS
jgi:hypothetical protein